MNFIYEAFIIIPVGMVLLRLAGKKTIAEMTPLEIITTLSIGTLISHAIVEEGVLKTVTAMVIIVTILIIAQLIQLKSKWFEKIFIGNATIVVKNGLILTDNLRKLRMTSKQLEMRFRQQGIKTLRIVKTATIEANGQLGFELYPEAEPVTYEDLTKIIQQLIDRDFVPPQKPEGGKESNLFSKI
jgi:uncharacterized membrane protein YcaP (DUF421 family)